MVEKLKDKASWLIFLAVCLSLIIFKFPDLSLPFFWDEAWVYGKAARTMADNGISLLPGSLNYELGRGHPLLFHASFAIFLKLFGNNIFNAHLLALVISIILLLSSFLISEKTIKKKTGWIVVLLIAVQPVFIAQCGLVLPEISLSLFIMVSLYAFTFKKTTLLLISSTCAILIKESAIILFLFMNLSLLFDFKLHKQNLTCYLKRILIINSPLLLWLAHLTAHKIQFGNFFFHEHASYISFNWAMMTDKLERIFYFSFLAQGRNIIFFEFILVFFYLIKKRELFVLKNRLSISFIVLIILYFAFSSVNYYSDRYTLVCILLFLFLFTHTVYTSSLNNIIKISIFTIAAISGIFSVFKTTAFGDIHPDYACVVKNHQQTINYMVNKMNKDDTIYVWFNMKEELANHYPGYIESDNYFINLKSHPSGNCRYFVFSNIENPEELNKLSSDYRLMPYKNFKYGEAWTAILKKP